MDTLPAELIAKIGGFLPSSALHALTQTNKYMYYATFNLLASRHDMIHLDADKMHLEICKAIELNDTQHVVHMFEDENEDIRENVPLSDIFNYIALCGIRDRNLYNYFCLVIQRIGLVGDGIHHEVTEYLACRLPQALDIAAKKGSDHVVALLAAVMEDHRTTRQALNRYIDGN